MSTNYFLHRDFCKCCGKPKEILHIGKRSAGWKFLFENRDEFRQYKDLDSFLDTGIIYDEYDEKYTKKEFIDIVEMQQKYKPRDKSIDNYLYFDTYNYEEYEFYTVEFS